jgi:hypothetical protein
MSTHTSTTAPVRLTDDMIEGAHDAAPNLTIHDGGLFAAIRVIVAPDYIAVYDGRTLVESFDDDMAGYAAALRLAVEREIQRFEEAGRLKN